MGEVRCVVDGGIVTLFKYLRNGADKFFDFLAGWIFYFCHNVVILIFRILQFLFFPKGGENIMFLSILLSLFVTGFVIYILFIKERGLCPHCRVSNISIIDDLIDVFHDHTRLNWVKKSKKEGTSISKIDKESSKLITTSEYVCTVEVGCRGCNTTFKDETYRCIKRFIDEEKEVVVCEECKGEGEDIREAFNYSVIKTKGRLKTGIFVSIPCKHCVGKGYFEKKKEKGITDR